MVSPMKVFDISGSVSFVLGNQLGLALIPSCNVKGNQGIGIIGRPKI
jgi:hypothetical protein